MSLGISLGASQLLQLGISISDIALAVRHGRRVGSWFQVNANDQDLLDTLQEVPEAILKRRGLIWVPEIEKRWSRIYFVYQGSHHDSGRVSLRDKSSVDSGMSAFSWVMVILVSALDKCLPGGAIKTLLIRVFLRIRGELEGTEESLRALLSTNIESWREAGAVRHIAEAATKEMERCRSDLMMELLSTDQSSVPSGRRRNVVIPQLSMAEAREMEALLVWLLADTEADFTTTSATVFATARAVERVGLKLRTAGSRSYESEPFVHFDRHGSHQAVSNISTRALKHLPILRAQQVSYPKDDPSAMIQACSTDRHTLNLMEQMWTVGADAAKGLSLEPVQTLMPYSPLESDICYRVVGAKPVQKRYAPFLPFLGANAFSIGSDSILMGLEQLLEGTKDEDASWLGQRTQIEYLQHSKEVLDEKGPKLSLLMGYQAFTFGFYYELLKTVVSFELTTKGAYFRGLWGSDGRELLFRCTQFGKALRNETASRAQVLYLLSTMYNARQKRYSESVPKGLIGILGPVSVLARPLIRTTDNPSEICKYMVIDLPIFDLMADTDGELYSGIGGGYTFDDPFSPPKRLVSKPSGKRWSVHARMGALFDEENGPGRVVMVARCDLRPVAWFSPHAADFAFLSGAYQPLTGDRTDEEVIEAGDNGFEVTDDDWQRGVIPRAENEDGDHAIGLVCSKGCAALRYAAAGILLESGQEICIATHDLEAAYNRIQKPGMLIC